MGTFLIPLSACRFTLEELSAAHLFPTEGTVCESGPIVVSRLNDGNYFVHNGRHRAIRAMLRGETFIEAVSLYDDDTESSSVNAACARRTPVEGWSRALRRWRARSRIICMAWRAQNG